jgi:hypothetical protein
MLLLAGDHNSLKATSKFARYGQSGQYPCGAQSFKTTAVSMLLDNHGSSSGRIDHLIVLLNPASRPTQAHCSKGGKQGERGPTS